jgi:nitrile hydratase
VTSPVYRTGDRVRIADRAPVGHMRTPAYVRGQVGRIERYCGAFPNPEDLAYGGDGLPARDLYRVRLSQTALWRDYGGAAGDTLEVEIYAHWLEPADGEGG